VSGPRGARRGRAGREGEPLAPGVLVELDVEKGVFRGRGLARLGGRVVFVPRAHPGDRVRARVEQVHAGWAEAELVELLRPSAGRRSSPCPYVPRCGGCSYQDYDSTAELALKEAVLRESLARAGAPWDGAVELHASPESGWRMRASLHVGRQASGPTLGLRQEGTRRVVDVRACLQLSEAMNAAAEAVRDALAANADLAARVYALDLAEAPDGSGLTAVLESSVERAEAPRLRPLLARVPGLTGFGVATREHSLEWLSGSPFVEANVLGLALRAHTRGFFQANRFLLEPLARTVLELLPAGDSRVLDLYAGVGLFALPLAARDGGEVVAVEHSALAAEDARFSAARAGLPLRVREGDVERALAGLAPAPGERIVLDPPRTGAGRAVVASIVARRPAVVVYVSCDPPTLGRDLALFAAGGYRPDTVHLFDQFPKTFHVEAVVRLLPL
jgi:23S rRNA (uracil1939-C5)-methyltransferase